MQERAVRLEKIALTSRAVEFPPGATPRMAIRTQGAQAHPPAVIIARKRTKVMGGINLTGTVASERVVPEGALGDALPRVHRQRNGVCM
jgi:hypothetical protein